MEHDDERRPDTGTAAMSEEDPERTRLGAHLEDPETTYTGEEEEVTGRAEGTDRPEPPDPDEPYRADRPGGGGSPLFADEEDRLDRPPPADEG
jgi:hypothetical protein